MLSNSAARLRWSRVQFGLHMNLSHRNADPSQRPLTGLDLEFALAVGYNFGPFTNVEHDCIGPRFTTTAVPPICEDLPDVRNEEEKAILIHLVAALDQLEEQYNAQVPRCEVQGCGAWAQFIKPQPEQRVPLENDTPLLCAKHVSDNTNLAQLLPYGVHFFRGKDMHEETLRVLACEEENERIQTTVKRPTMLVETESNDRYATIQAQNVIKCDKQKKAISKKYQERRQQINHEYILQPYANGSMERAAAQILLKKNPARTQRIREHDRDFRVEVGKLQQSATNSFKSIVPLPPPSGLMANHGIAPNHLDSARQFSILHSQMMGKDNPLYGFQAQSKAIIQLPINPDQTNTVKEEINKRRVHIENVIDRRTNAREAKNIRRQRHIEELEFELLQLQREEHITSFVTHYLEFDSRFTLLKTDLHFGCIDYCHQFGVNRSELEECVQEELSRHQVITRKSNGLEKYVGVQLREYDESEATHPVKANQKRPPYHVKLFRPCPVVSQPEMIAAKTKLEVARMESTSGSETTSVFYDRANQIMNLCATTSSTTEEDKEVKSFVGECESRIEALSEYEFDVFLQARQHVEQKRVLRLQEEYARSVAKREREEREAETRLKEKVCFEADLRTRQCEVGRLQRINELQEYTRCLQSVDAIDKRKLYGQRWYKMSKKEKATTDAEQAEKRRKCLASYKEFQLLSAPLRAFKRKAEEMATDSEE